MYLDEYLYKNKIMKKDFAKLLGVSRWTISRICVENTCNPTLAKKIELQTGGKVKYAIFMKNKAKKLAKKWRGYYEGKKKVKVISKQKDLFE